jgi:hypothetical protein
MRAITKFAAAAAALSLTAFAGSADAAIFIGLQQAGVNGGAITTVASGGFAAVYAAAYGSFELELLTGTEGVAPGILGTTTNDTNSVGGSGAIDIYVTRNDITGPIPHSFLSTFTSNALPAGWTVTQRTYVSTADQLYTGDLLASHAFSAIGTFVSANTYAGGSGPYSVTTRYSLNAPTIGSSLSTISVSGAVPEPGTWALMIAGFGGAGAMLRRRRQAAATA